MTDSAISYYESQIRGKHYVSEGSARAAVTRAGLSKNETARLHQLATEVYSDANGKVAATKLVKAVNGAVNGATHNGNNANELDRIAFNLCMYAARKNIKPQDAIGELVERIGQLNS